MTSNKTQEELQQQITQKQNHLQTLNQHLKDESVALVRLLQEQFPNSTIDDDDVDTFIQMLKDQVDVQKKELEELEIVLAEHQVSF